MMQYLKRGICILLLFLLAGGRLAAQDEQYFVYIQHERSQPFYVKYKGKLLSSSERGYIILSELPAGTLPITIGFPKNESPEQQFRIRLGKHDQGFLLKHMDDKTYALYNLQTFSVTMAGGEGGENGRLVSLDNPGEGAGETGAATNPAPPVETEALAADNGSAAMMADLRKDLDTTFAGKAEVTAVQRPATERNPFAAALDKVVSDDRPDDISLETPAAAAPAATTAGATMAVGTEMAAPGEGRKNRRKRNKDKGRDRSPLTEEEQALLQQVLAAERRAGARADSIAAAQQSAAPEAAPSVEQDQPIAAQSPVVTDASAYTEEAPEKKPRKSKRKREAEPAFIEFMDDATQQTAKVPVTAGADAPAVSAEIPVTDESAVSKPAKRKKKKLADMIDATEHPNNILTGDSVDYRAPLARSSRKERKDDGVKMINSDCDEVMDDDTFRKLLRKVVGAKDDEGMVAAFRRHVRDYCLETGQVRQLALLISADEYRYRLLDLAYPKVYDSDKYASLSSVLSDSYYQGRFKAMLHK
ncbi:DUF4476 domain-containing protein [Chitinophaga japonensis]|nr:DUF4476 domain-containing protein [Chitinophaga japonensis]